MSVKLRDPPHIPEATYVDVSLHNHRTDVRLSSTGSAGWRASYILDSRKIPATPDRPPMQSTSVSSLTAPTGALPSENEDISSLDEQSGDNEVLRKSSRARHMFHGDLSRRARHFLTVSSLAIIVAASATIQLFFATASAEAVAKGYASADSDLRPGMAVSLVESTQSGSSAVTSATRDNLERVVGIATTADSSLVTVGSADAQIYVETDGTVDAYVSDVNGIPKKGDQLTVSPIKGVLMLSPNASMAVAIAEGNFDESNAESYDLQGNDPKSTKITLQKVNLDAKGLGRANSNNTSPLASIGRTITGKDVSDVRVLVSLIVFLLVMLSEGSILYGAISSAIRSVGRNPLAKTAITKELVRVALIAVAVLILGVGAVSALLWI